MLRNLFIVSIILVIAASCRKDDTPDKTTIENYLKEHNITTAKSNASGLYYVIQEPGAGSHPNTNSVVTVNYKGYLTDGTVFDQSAAGKPYTSRLSNLIAGWQQGIPLISAGGKIQLFIPSALGYGSSSQGKIPANSVLIFDIELIKFN